MGMVPSRETPNISLSRFTSGGSPSPVAHLICHRPLFTNRRVGFHRPLLKRPVPFGGGSWSWLPQMQLPLGHHEFLRRALLTCRHWLLGFLREDF